ncbi:MAG TPA: hypothetical protein VEA60_00870 [Allosphingosinicella sp.]|nr:hypothetical protein [Allosphingosinicella sp.]
MRYVETFVLPAFEPESITSEVDLYLSFFHAAVADEVPPHFEAQYGESFRRHVTFPGWVIQCLISNAIKEGEGSRDLGDIASACLDPGLQAELVSHTDDEARHCRLYLQLVELIFPSAMPADLRAEIEKQMPPLSFRPDAAQPLKPRDLLDCLIQVNLGEVRTRIHQKLLEPVLHLYCPEADRGKLARALEWLSSDETRHIRYTAQRIGELSRIVGTADAEALFVSRARDFNAYTRRELGSQREGLFGPTLAATTA